MTTPSWAGVPLARPATTGWTILLEPMTQLRTAVLMKTDIAESTPHFRALLAADLQAVVAAHRAMVERLAGDEHGHIFKASGDGYWLEFPSATNAARSAIAMQEALRLALPTKGLDRLSMRVVIGLGDTAIQDGDFTGDVLALMARVEDITPPNEIYLTTAAALALTPSEIRTTIVGSFEFKGFDAPTAIYRVEQRHRTHTYSDAWILVSDLRGFGGFAERNAPSTIERVLDALDTLVATTNRNFAGTIRSASGDNYLLTFPDAQSAMLAAEKLSGDWTASRREHGFTGAINICLHRGTFHAFRSFLYGPGLEIAGGVLPASIRRLGGNERNIFVTSEMHEGLSGSPWHERLELLFSDLNTGRYNSLKVFRLKP
jgi:class 3 adenylate cyclase